MAGSILEVGAASNIKWVAVHAKNHHWFGIFPDPTTDLMSALVSVSSPVKAVVWRGRGEGGGLAPKLPAPSLTPLVAGRSTRQKVIAF